MAIFAKMEAVALTDLVLTHVNALLSTVDVIVQRTWMSARRDLTYARMEQHVKTRTEDIPVSVSMDLKVTIARIVLLVLHLIHNTLW